MSKPGPIGAVLAGGRGRRLGGEKARAPLAGRPLIAWPLAALTAVLEDVVVVAKAATLLPDLPGVAVWTEPEEPFHPRAGIVHALERGGGRPVLACAGDLPFVTPGVVRRLAAEPAGGAPAVVPRAGGRLQPLLARYEPAALAGLRGAPAEASLAHLVLALGARVVDVADARPFVNVNTPGDLAAAAQELARDS